ncbi:hypothetical protein CLOM_g11431 [Closterium sp. NIES-68]|nr:hypothetical protein CLOM_g11431 [Closterium sp. NIES-68]GJP72945.1 hypothetical protein CLOP_g3713 [Closterium sp. NIES-67]
MADAVSNCKPSLLNPCHPQQAQPTGSFSPTTFAAALAVCLILVFTVATAVCVIRRLKWFDVDLDSGPAERPHPRVIWVRNLDQKPAIPGLDRATIRSFPVFTYRGSDGLGSDAPLVEEGRSGPASGAENRAGSQAEKHVAVTVDGDAREPAAGKTSLRESAPSLGESAPSLRDCAVCLGEYAAGERIKVVPACAHGFHADCIDLWLAAKTTCPICRTDLRRPASPDAAAPKAAEVAVTERGLTGGVVTEGVVAERVVTEGVATDVLLQITDDRGNVTMADGMASEGVRIGS